MKALTRQKQGRTEEHRHKERAFRGFVGLKRRGRRKVRSWKKKGKLLSVWMEMVRVSFFFFSLVAILATAVLPAINAQISPAPAPASDGVTIDQGIAYVLMLAALVVTYLVH